MANKGLWSGMVWLVGMAAPLLANAGPLPPEWQIQPTAQQEIDGGLPSALRSPLLTKQNKPLQQVDMMVALPFEQVLPVVKAALAPLGRFEGNVSNTRLAYMEHGWGDVMMARRPELKAEYVRRFSKPEFEQAVADGALLAEEVPMRMARLERDPSFDAQSDKLPALQANFANWSASADHRHGFAGRTKSIIEVRVMQVDQVIGRPATVVNLRRVDDWPNPDGGLVGQLRALADFNILSSGPSARLSRSRVPESVFTPVFDALRTLPGASMQLGANAHDWIPAPKPVATIVEPQRRAPDGKQGLDATQVLAVNRVLSEQTFDLADMLPMADGSVLLVQSYPFTLMQWSPADGVTPRTLWKSPSDHVLRWLLAGDRQGRSAYLANETQVLRHDVGTSSVTVHPLGFDTPDMSTNSYLRYTHDGDGVPLPYLHDQAGKRDALSLWTLAQQPAANGSRWEYVRRFAALRQDVMDHRFPGNTQLKPVQWDGPRPNVWAEDAAGLTELDGDTGRVLRVVPLPRRFGKANTQDDTGMAQWTPSPFGSIKGNWIAVGFVLMDGERRNPGMHVVDVASGKVRYSLTLPDRDSLNAAAGSPDGRLLALGANGGGVVGALWNLDTGQSLSLRSGKPGCWDLRQLHWSPDGATLWGRCGDGLVQWALPAEWRSAAAG